MKLENKNKKQLKSTADKLFSEYIRNRYSDWRGYSKCYTCGKTLKIKEAQCGHFFSRGKMNTRYDEDNARIQCSGCNVFKHGNYTEYSIRLHREIGTKKWRELEKKSKQRVKLTKEWYIEIIEDIKKKMKNLKNKEKI